MISSSPVEFYFSTLWEVISLSFPEGRPPEILGFGFCFYLLFTQPTPIRMPSPPRLTSLPLDITGITAGLFSLSVELQPLRTADEVTALLVALRRYPRDLPHRDEKIVQHLGGKYSSTQIKDLVDRLDAASPAFMQLSSSLPFAGDDKIFLVCPVDNCVACAHAPPLVVKTRGRHGGGGGGMLAPRRSPRPAPYFGPLGPL